MPASQEQKVDFLLKKIGYSASKTGIAEDESTIGLSTNTAKKPFEEGIASPLVIPSTTILSDSSFIPTTPPGSDTLYVKGYRTATALRMTRDSTVGTNTRSYIAYTTYNDTSSARLTNWIDTQFGSSYIIKVFKGDPNSGGVELQQAGGNAGTDGWFFDYSSGVLNFNGINLPDGVTATNIYIVGYRYIGATGVQPPAGIGTFHDLVVHNNFSVAGLSTFNDDVRFVGAAGTVFFDKSQNALEFTDDTQLRFGSDDTLKIYHDSSDNNTYIRNQQQSSHFYIQSWGTNRELFLQAKGNVEIWSGTTDQALVARQGGRLELYHSNTKVLQTGDHGIDIIGSLVTTTGVSTFAGDIDANGIIEGIAGQNKIPSLYSNYSDLPNASTYHGMFAHVHATQKGYFAHAGNWMELVNKETTGIVGTGTERYDIGYLDATNLYVSGITTLGSIGISTGLISGPAITYIDPATVGDNTGLLVVKGNLQVDGTQTTVNSSTMTVTDKNIEIAKGAANDAAVDGAGITVESGEGNKTWNWVDATDSWTSSEHIRVASGKVFGFANDPNTYIDGDGNDTINFTTNGSKRISITATGEVGINSTSPREKLDVIGNANIIVDNNKGIKLGYRGESKTAYIGLDANDAANAGTQSWGNSSYIGFYSDGSTERSITYRTNVGSHIFQGTNGDEFARINSTGSVGIGSTIPNAKLDVIGNTKLQGDLNVAGVTTFKDDVEFHGVAGITSISFDKSDNSLKFIDNAKLKFGDSTDLQLYHSGNNSNVYHTGTGNLNLLTSSGNISLVVGGSNKVMLRATPNAAVELIYDNTKRFETTSTGAQVTGNLSVTGITTTLQLQVGTLGHTMVGITTILDEDDMTSDSATALATQQSIKKYIDDRNPAGPGGGALAVSADTGSNESINLNTEVLDIEGTANEIETATGTNKVVIGLPDNVSIGGTLNVGAGLTVVGISTFGNDIKLHGDSREAQFGANNDLAIKWDGSKGGVYTDEFRVKDRTNNVNMLAISKTGAFRAYHNGSNRLDTTGYGATVFGTTETQKLNVTGISTFTGGATFNGTISAGSTTGTDGYYLKSVGTGVTWAAFPSSRTGLTTTATAGQTSFNFSYNVGFVDVFVNGVKLPSSEFTANNGSTIVLDDAAFANDTLEFISLNTVPVTSGGGASNLNGLADVTITGSPVVGETLQHNGSEFVNDYTVTATTTSTSQTAILSLATATYRSVEYTIQVTEGTKYHVTKVLAIHDGTNVTFNEYGTLTTSTSLSTFALDVSSGNMRLLATPASTNSTAFKVKFTAIKV